MNTLLNAIMTEPCDCRECLKTQNKIKKKFGGKPPCDCETCSFPQRFNHEKDTGKSIYCLKKKRRFTWDLELKEGQSWTELLQQEYEEHVQKHRKRMSHFMICSTCGLRMCKSLASFCSCDDPTPSDKLTYVKQGRCFVLSELVLDYKQALGLLSDEEQVRFKNLHEIYRKRGFKVAICYRGPNKKKLEVYTPVVPFNSDSLCDKCERKIGNDILDDLKQHKLQSGSVESYMEYLGNNWFYFDVE